MSRIKLSALQMTSQPSVEANQQKIEQLIQSNLPSAEHQLLVLPECALFFGGSDKQQLAIMESLSDGDIQRWLSDLAKRYCTWLVAGTFPIKAANDKFYACSLVYGPSGELKGHYNKIHLFDVDVADNTSSYLESRYTQAGSHISQIDTPFTSVGQIVCYDLRFSGLFHSMLGCGVITVPAAFTRVTGNAHWHTLLKARAIENQCYIVAAGQVGVHENNRETYGHSIIVDPWGEITAELSTDEGIISADFSVELLQQIRAKMPIMSQQRFRSSWIE